MTFWCPFPPQEGTAVPQPPTSPPSPMLGPGSWGVLPWCPLVMSDVTLPRVAPRLLGVPHLPGLGRTENSRECLGLGKMHVHCH